MQASAETSTDTNGSCAGEIVRSRGGKESRHLKSLRKLNPATGLRQWPICASPPRLALKRKRRLT